MSKQGRLGILLLVSWALAGPAHAGPTNSPLPGGLADVTGRIGYVASPVGGIEAIDLVTGDVLWASIEAQVPLLAADDRLYAQAGVKRNRLRVLVYDVQHRGEVVLESDPVVFPGGLSLSAGRSFKAEWKLERDSLVLCWRASAWYHGQEKPNAEQETAASKKAEGKVRIDLTTGKVQHLLTEPVVVSMKPEAPVKELEKKAVRWQGVVGGHYKAIVLEPAGDQHKLVLLSWDRNGVAAPPRDLMRGKQIALMPSLDEQLICFREVQPNPDQRVPASERERYAWSLINLDTAEVVARVAYEASTLAMTVVGPRLFVMQAGPLTGPLTQTVQGSRILKAIDLKTGKMLWQQTIAAKAHYPPDR